MSGTAEALPERMRVAHAALAAYAQNGAHEGVTDPDLVAGLLTDVLHAAAAAGHNTGALLNQAHRHITEEAEKTEAAHIVGATVRLRVVSYAGGMVTGSLREALRVGIEALALSVEGDDETTPERVWPWVRVENIRTEHRHSVDHDV